MLSRYDGVALPFTLLHSARRKRIRLVRMKQGQAVRGKWGMIQYRY